MREHRGRSANSWWAYARTPEQEARRAEKKRDRAAAHDAAVASGGWIGRAKSGPELVGQHSETTEIRFEQAFSRDSVGWRSRGRAHTILGSHT